MNILFAIKYVRSHSACNVPLILFKLFIKLLDRMHWTVTFFRGFFLLYKVQLPVTLIGQIGVKRLILVGYNTAVTKDTVI